MGIGRHQRGEERRDTKVDGLPESVGLLVSFSTNRKLLAISLAALVASVGLLYYIVITPETFGSALDDGSYVAAAKSLASGEGYRISSVPYDAAQTKYPPLYPFLLSLIWRVDPNFPQNTMLMMALSAIASLAVLLTSWLYLTRSNYATPGVGLLLVLVVSTNLYTIIYSTSVLSEMTFALLSLLALSIGERHLKEGGARSGLLLGMMVGMAFLTRVTGLALIVSMVVYCLHRKTWRKAVLPGLIALSFVTGWTVWSYVNRSRIERPNAAFYSSYAGHVLGIVDNAVRAHQHSSELTALLSIVGKNTVELALSIPLTILSVNLEWVPDLGGGLTLFAYILSGICFLLMARGFARDCRSGLRLLHVYLVCYLVLHLPFPYSGYFRYLVPVLPFLALFFVKEIAATLALVRAEISASRPIAARLSAVVLSVILVLIVGIGLTNYGFSIRWSLTSASFIKRNRPPLMDREAIAWIHANTNINDVLVCDRDPMYYLYTGRRATHYSVIGAGPSFPTYQPSPEQRREEISRILFENAARYVILHWAPREDQDDYTQSYRDLIEEDPGRFVRVFTSSDGETVIYRVECRLGR
jgi:Dolichyl-phosphate-mannose-protein mannosyltransferase